MSVEERFWYYCGAQSDGCWEWTGARTAAGYGQISLGDGRREYSHRYSYELLVGPIPAGFTIDHLCRRRSCDNPEHLEAVTLAENKRRGMSIAAVNARKTHCHRGHEFTVANTIRQSGGRACRTCVNAAKVADRRRKALERRAVA